MNDNNSNKKTVVKKNCTLAKSLSKALILDNEQVKQVSGAAMCKDCRTTYWANKNGITQQVCDEFWC